MSLGNRSWPVQLTVFFWFIHSAGAVKCYVCSTHFDIKGPADLLSSFVLQNYKEESSFRGQCIDRPKDGNVTECMDGCITMGGKGHLLRGKYATTGDEAAPKVGVADWHNARGNSGVGRRCVEHLTKLSEGLTVPETETCELQEGNILGVQAHVLICRCNTDLCNTRTDIFEKFAEASCTVYHIPSANVSNELEKNIIDETDSADRQTCITECAAKEGCNSVRIQQNTDGSGIKCAMSSYRIPCDGVYPTELADDVESPDIGAYWLSCLSKGCKDPKAKRTTKNIAAPNNCFLKTIDIFPAYCNQLQNEMKDRRFCKYRGFKSTCQRTCCDF